MPALSINSDSVHQGIVAAAVDLQAYFMREQGTCYLLEDLQKALIGWLELSVEALVDDALFHTVEGDRTYAFNRSAFELQLKQLQPVDSKNCLQKRTGISAPISAEQSVPRSDVEIPTHPHGTAIA